MSKLLIAITSVPKRFNTTLEAVLHRYSELGHPILLSIPKRYVKWGHCDLPSYLYAMKNLIIYRPAIDYGPATKLLGALAYLRSNRSRETFDHILTLDDDIEYIRLESYIATAQRVAEKHPDFVLTPGGMLLRRHPFRFKDGLEYMAPLAARFVDCLAGYQGVMYPARYFVNNDLVFDLIKYLPAGVFNDDDAYFSILCSVLDIPIYSYEMHDSYLDHNESLSEKFPDAVASAVTEGVEISRIENESHIFQFAVEQGVLPTRFSALHSAREKESNGNQN